jgi:outer membrane protein assembly factor BamB
MSGARIIPLFLLLSMLPASLGLAGEPSSGWRGNGTGLWPEAKTPAAWQRIPRGAMDGLRCAANRSTVDAPAMPRPVEKGLIRDWLIVGPFVVADSVKDFDQDFLSGEANAEPAAGDKAGDKTWSVMTAPPDDFMVFGTAEMPWLDLAKPLGFAKNQVAYAHTNLHSPRGGPARIVVDHGHGLKLWLNSKELYRSPERRIQLGYYTALSKLELSHHSSRSPQMDIELKPGWNRLLLKLSTSNREDFTDMRVSLRISDPPNVPYETKNIAWMTPLPARSTSTPILVKDRLFVMAEPDELLCVDKATGKILWTAAVNYYEALTPAERKARPEFAERVDPLVADLAKTTDRVGRLKLRKSIGAILASLDEASFGPKYDGHFESHFGIVGFTMPTPVSDRERVYVWSGLGVAACYQLDGQREWITRVDAGELTYGSSPALADGVLVTFLNRLYGLDAKTGKVLWEQPKIRNNVAALLAANFGSEQVVVTQRGDIIRPRDGEILFRPQGSSQSGDTGWSPPVILGQTVFVPKYGVAQLNLFDYTGVSGDRWTPKLIASHSLPSEINKTKTGGWLDRWTAGSPLIWQDIAYVVDIYQTLYALDLKTGKMLYRQELDLEGFTHYNSVAVAASPTLVGHHIVVMDNQGTALVLEPGPEFKVVSRNRIATQLDRLWPLPAQETLAYAPPLVDGNRLYLRGEAYLYCVGEK